MTLFKEYQQECGSHYNLEQFPGRENLPSHVINNMVQISLVWDRAYSVRRPNNNLKDGYGGLNALCSETKQNSSNDGGEYFFENSPSSRPGTGKAWAGDTSQRKPCHTFLAVKGNCKAMALFC